MSASRSLIVILFAMVTIGMSSPARAQSGHVAESAALQQAIQTKIAADTSDRAVVLRVLKSSEAQAVADRFGLDLTRAQAGVGALDDAALAQLATSARMADTQLSGGRSNTVVISTTTLLLGLILLVLILR